MSKKENDSKHISRGWFFAGSLVAALALATPFVIMLLSSRGFNVKDLSSLGAVGDFFGGSTIGLLSIASILFIIHTISIQSKELSMQREELELTRNEMKRTREEYEVTNETMKLQQFESTFFNMMLLLDNIVKSISVGSGDENVGRKGFFQLYNYFPIHVQDNAEKVLSEYHDFYKDNQSDLGHYFSHITSVLKFIDNSDVKNKDVYIDILKSQLSTYELVHLYYFSNSDYAIELGPLSQKYDLLQNLDSSLLFENL
ncbi:putative phage abortive infection protein [Halobacillus salinus]|uniref:putative phage abortive infection protein n=1 Tax=Halobacillus salinus TaxID=192814 RepID=UPI0009A74DFA|nr:putative phage abortive infection protein [Halobacillus salinus]